jgi:uncharacterized protein (TIGR00661 family)
MKVLYAIQGTGNGHVSRAREVVPVLKQMAEVDVFLSGTNFNLNLPFEVKYQSKGVSFQYDKTGGIDYLKTIRNINPLRVRKEILDFPVQDYDLIINDFEFISAWAAWYRNVPCLAFSHQVALLSNHTPKPADGEFPGKTILKNYAPASYAVGLHFKSYDDYIFTPVIRKEIRNLETSDKGHYTVYLPAVSDQTLLNVLHQIPHVFWEVFSKNARHSYITKNVSVRPAHLENYMQSLAACKGLLTGAGFESPAEAMFLGKKLFVIPIHGQYEQQCNAVALKELGVYVEKRFSTEIVSQLENWLCNSQTYHAFYPDITEQLTEHILLDQRPFLEPLLAAG